MTDLVWKEPKSSRQPWVASVDGRVEYKVSETLHGTWMLESASGMMVEYTDEQSAKDFAEYLRRSRLQREAKEAAEKAVQHARGLAGVRDLLNLFR